MQPVIEVRSLDFSRGDKKIFDRVDFDFIAGKVTAVMGPSGTGKTTLLRLLAGLLRPDHGTVLMDGENIHQVSRQRLYTMRKRIGMLFQSSGLFTDFSVYDNLALPLRENTKMPESLIHKLVLSRLHAVGLRGTQGLMPSELSGGMARRVALARALTLDPAVVLYDEPFTGQDPISMGILLRLIRSVNDALGITSIIVSHDVEEVLSIADYAYVIAGGKVVDSGSVDALKSSSSLFTQQFIAGEADGAVPFHYPAKPYRDDLFGVHAKPVKATSSC